MRGIVSYRLKEKAILETVHVVCDQFGEFSPASCGGDDPWPPPSKFSNMVYAQS